MQNEILRPVLETDKTAIPRYDIVNPDGSVSQQNVELRLKNEIVQQGTPYDEESVLPISLLNNLGLPSSATPADVFKTLGAELRVTTEAGVVVTASKGNSTVSKTADSSGIAVFKILELGTWTVSAKINDMTISTDYEIKAIAQYELALSTNLETTSWGAIDSISRSGKASSLWSVGDKKTINVDGIDYQFQIIGFNHDDKTAGGKAGITFQMVDCMNTIAHMNSSNTNRDGWTSCAMRNSTMSTLLTKLPSALQKVIKAVNKPTSAGNQSATINTTSDKLFLLSEVEIFGSTPNSKPSEGSQYAYYKAGNSKVKKVNGSLESWWERSPDGTRDVSFCCVTVSGTAKQNSAANSQGVSFAFCV